MQSDFEQRVRERAYFLWQKEGSPDGREQEYWERARLLMQAESDPPIATPLQARSPEERAVDEAAKESFPASDPPAFAATAGPGNEPRATLPDAKK